MPSAKRHFFEGGVFLVQIPNEVNQILSGLRSFYSTPMWLKRNFINIRFISFVIRFISFVWGRDCNRDFSYVTTRFTIFIACPEHSHKVFLIRNNEKWRCLSELLKEGAKSSWCTIIEFMIFIRCPPRTGHVCGPLPQIWMVGTASTGEITTPFIA